MPRLSSVRPNPFARGPIVALAPLTVALLVLASVAFMVGCGPKETPRAPGAASKPAPSPFPPAPPLPGEAAKGKATDPSAPKGTIGVSVLTLTNPFFKVLADSLAEEARTHGYEVLTVSGELDPDRQQNQVKDFIVRKFAAIVLTPCDSKAVGAAIREANQAGIPVFTADIACMAPDAAVVCHIATDNYGGGLEAARAIIEAVGGKGKVAIIEFPQVESCIQRTTAFEAFIAEENRKPEVQVEIVARLTGNGAREPSFAATQDLLQAHPDVNGIFAVNDPTALGARAALENAGKADQVVIVGFDGQPEGRQAIKEGKIYADPIQFPERIGKTTAQTIAKYFRGEDVPKEILIPTELYRKADAEKDPTLK